MNSTIDNLNFGVIIDDTEFNDQIKKMEAEAKRFNTSMSNLLNLKKQAQQWSQADVENNRRAWQAKVDEERAQERINREKIKSDGLQRKINAQIDAATDKYKAQSRVMGELKNLALGYLSIHGATQLLSSLVRVTGEFELQKTTLAAMLGDLNAAEGVLTRIQGLAVKSPFQFKELTTYAKQLSAFSVPAQELYDTTKMLADISAGLGVGMDRIVLAYGQVRSAVFLRGQEVRQFTEAGIPILNELAKQFTELEGRAVSAGDVFDKTSKRLVPFEMVAKVFKDMTSEGGKFYNMQEVQAETLKGKISNLKDAYEIMLNEIGQNQSDKLKGAVDLVRRLMQNYEELGRTLVQLVVTYGVTKTATELLAVAFGKLQLKSVSLIKTLRNVQAFAMKNPYTLIAAGLTAAGIGIYKWSTRLQEAEKIQKSVTDTSQDYYKSLATETSKLNTLYAKLKLAKEETEEYADAKKQIYTQYAPYIAQLKEEGKNVQDLASIYEDLKLKIEASQKAKFRDIASQDIEQTFGNSTAKLLKQTDRKIKGLGKDMGMSFSELEHQALIAYVTGSLSAEDILNNPELSRIGEVMALPIFKGVDKLKEAFADASKAYQDGLVAIEKLYGKATAISNEDQPFIYSTEEDGDDPNKKAADRIQEEINAVKKLRDAYQTLAPYMNGEMLRKTLTALFPNADQQLIQSLDFRGKLVELAAELNKFDESASKRLLDSLSGEKASEIASAFKAIETYKNMLDQWFGEDFTLTGTGVNFDISKIIRDLNNQYAKIGKKAIEANDLLTKAQMGDEEALKTVREVYGEEVWQKYLTDGSATIEKLANLEREEAKKTAAEKIRDLADSYVKDRLKKLDLNDWSDKTLKQMKTIEAEVQKIMEEGVDIDDETIQKIKDAGLTLEEFTKLVGEGFSATADTVEEEIRKKIVENVKTVISVMSDVGDAVTNLGKKIGDSGIESLGKSFSDAADMLPELMEAAEANDTPAIIINMLSYLVTNIMDTINYTYEAQEKLYDAALNYRELLLDIARKSHSGIWGENELALAAENVRILTEAQKEYSETLRKVNEVKFQGYRNAGGFGRTGMKNQSVADMLEYFANAHDWDLYRENGEINIAAVESYYDTFKDSLTRKQRRLVQQLIENGNAYEDAAAQQAEYLTNLFSRVADNIATSMVDAFIESGDAAMDMGEIVSNVSKQMVADLIKSLYIMPILSDYKDKFLAIDETHPVGTTANTEAKVELLETALSQIAGKSDEITETLEHFAEYLRDGKGGENGLSEGIKGMTEDTANLRASYLNAIRADVAYSKVLWQRMDANTQAIANSLVGFSAPSLMDYQKRIEANTYNNMIATQSILARLNELITYEDGPASMRVLK